MAQLDEKALIKEVLDDFSPLLIRQSKSPNPDAIPSRLSIAKLLKLLSLSASNAGKLLKLSDPIITLLSMPTTANEGI